MPRVGSSRSGREGARLAGAGRLARGFQALQLETARDVALGDVDMSASRDPAANGGHFHASLARRKATAGNVDHSSVAALASMPSGAP